MIEPVIDHIASRPPEPGHRITFTRLDGSRSLDLVDLYEAAGNLARELGGLGIGAGDRIGILARNRVEWVLLDLAALRLKAVTAGFEPGKFEPGPALCRRYDLAVLFTDLAAAGTRPIDEVAGLAGRPGAPPPPVRWRPDDETTIKFTSGSTGEPKGLAATAGSIDASLCAVQEMFDHGRADDLFCFLPLSLLQQRYWIYSALRFGHDVTISTYEAALPALRRARPTVVMGVPAFYETAKKHIESLARRRAPDRRDPDRRDGDPGALREAAREVFGDRVRYLWTGSAPARPAMLRFFHDAGLPIYEGYGLNETCIVAKNHPGAHREGSVGRVLPGKKVMFDEDGLISIHSDHPVNRGYAYAPPGESARVFRAGGVVRTGDLGYLDDDGFLFITGRADDVIVLDNGKKVIVRPIEERLRAGAAIEECVVFCPAQTHLVAVVSPAREPADEAAIAEQVARANAALGPDEQIAKVVVAGRFSVEDGTLTSQFKPRRQEIFERYRAQLTAPARQEVAS
ncbi:MAG TPA: AMP-binding protein [Streptosporangiaceae bacterium]